MNEQIIKIEMDSNTLGAITRLLHSVDKSNRDLSPGKEVQRAFGIDITKILIGTGTCHSTMP